MDKSNEGVDAAELEEESPSSTDGSGLEESPNPRYEDVEKVFKRELARRQFIVRFSKLYGAFTIATVVYMVVALIINHYTNLRLPWPKWATVMQFGNLVFTGIAACIPENASTFINSTTDSRAAGPLIDMLHVHRIQYSSDGKTSTMAREALTRLFPEILVSGEGGLDSQRRSALGFLILKETDEKFVAASIDLLARIGGEEAVRPLESVVAGKAKCTGDDIRCAAQAALAIVQTRIGQERAHAVLLRPSDSTSDINPNLLRPSRGVVSSDSQTLMRPASESESLHQQT